MQDQPSPVTKHQLEFNGTGAEYFRIWIVNILLTICTLYIYSAWAKVRSKRYFYGNTVLDGSPFEYHAVGKQLLPGQLVAVALLLLVAAGEIISTKAVIGGIVVLALLLPWALCRSRMFNARVSSYRNIHFGFNGKASMYYKYLFLLPLIPVLIFGGAGAVLYFFDAGDTTVGAMVAIGVMFVYIMFPYIHGKIMAYTVNESQYGTSKFKGDITAGKVFIIYLKSILLSVLVMTVAMAIVLAGMFSTIGASVLQGVLEAGAESSLVIYAAIGGMYALMIPFSVLMKSYLECRLRNYQVNNTTLDNKFKLASTITTRKLFLLELTNLLLVLFTLGLGYPWAAVRKARFLANHTQISSAHNAEQFITDQNQKVSAMGEGIGDAFDMDVAAGF